MAVGYAYYEVENFPKMKIGQDIQTTTQLAIPGFGDDTIYTRIRFLGDSEHKAFSKYHITHETIRKIRARFLNEYCNQIIAVLDFNLFRAREGPWVLATAKRQHCREMFKRFEKDFKDFRWFERRVDLISLRQDLTGGVTGGWFTRLDIADLRSAGIFGPTVAESEEWERYEQAGDLSSIVIELTYAGAGQSIMITRTGTIVVYGTLGEFEGLELVRKINELVKEYSEVYSVGLEPRRRKRE